MNCRHCGDAITRSAGKGGLWVHVAIGLADHAAAPEPYADPEALAFFAAEAVAP